MIDPILLRLEDQKIEPGFVDPRHCLVFWARPTEAVRSLIAQIQLKLLVAAPSMRPYFISRYSPNKKIGANERV